ncbi:unnamed protein product, partial [Prorocentrum cordatum]
ALRPTSTSAAPTQTSTAPTETSTATTKDPAATAKDKYALTFYATGCCTTERTAATAWWETQREDIVLADMFVLCQHTAAGTASKEHREICGCGSRMPVCEQQEKFIEPGAREQEAPRPPWEIGGVRVLILAGGGLGGEGGDARAPFAGKLKAMMSWGLPPFRFLAPLRPRGRLWILDRSDAAHGFLGDLVPGSVDLLADFVESFADGGPVVALGISAGAHCITELLAHGRPRMEAAALGGLHGHGQPYLAGVPARTDPVGKFQDYLDRLEEHPGAPGGIWAVRAEDDDQCPRRCAEEALEALGARNAQQGFPRAQCALLPPCIPRAQYENSAPWRRRELLRALLRAARERGSEGAEHALGEVAGGAAGAPGAARIWLPCDADAAGDAASQELLAKLREEAATRRRNRSKKLRKDAPARRRGQPTRAERRAHLQG